MTKDEFYAQALLAAFPIAIELEHQRVSKSAVARVADEYAAELTSVFEEKRGSYKKKRRAKLAKKETP
jgi:hypothetical protein